MHEFSPYSLIAIGSVVITAAIWSRFRENRSPEDNHRLTIIYLSALAGAFLGAKLVYLASEGWMRLMDPNLTGPEKFYDFMVGKTITGAILGGYVSVELAKRYVGYRAPTGDLFALVVPIGLMAGRVGCLLHGCCLGVAHGPAWYTLSDAHDVHRWPAVPVEMLFNGVFFAFAAVCMNRRWLPGQLFHVYMIAYGVFRFSHEFLRDTPAVVGEFTGYQFAALAILLVGVIRFRQRQLESLPVGD